VTFERGSRLSTLGRFAFAECKSLQSICIPSSVETVVRFCFRYCSRLSVLTFESGSRISNFGRGAFAQYSSLRSICLLSSLTGVQKTCFRGCARLERVVLEAGSRLRADSLSKLRSKFEVSFM
jgi:hypothetical protein